MWSWKTLCNDLCTGNSLECQTEILWLALQRSMQHWVNYWTSNFRIYSINNCKNFKTHWLNKYISHNSSRLCAKFINCLVTRSRKRIFCLIWSQIWKGTCCQAQVSTQLEFWAGVQPIQRKRVRAMTTSNFGCQEYRYNWMNFRFHLNSLCFSHTSDNQN